MMSIPPLSDAPSARDLDLARGHLTGESGPRAYLLATSLPPPDARALLAALAAERLVITVVRMAAGAPPERWMSDPEVHRLAGLCDAGNIPSEEVIEAGLGAAVAAQGAPAGPARAFAALAGHAGRERRRLRSAPRALWPATAHVPPRPRRAPRPRGAHRARGARRGRGAHAPPEDDDDRPPLPLATEVAR